MESQINIALKALEDAKKYIAEIKNVQAKKDAEFNAKIDSIMVTITNRAMARSILIEEVFALLKSIKR